MALVGEIVARFKAETSDYLQKIDAAKVKNRELAKELLTTAGSADKAIASLNAAKGKNALGDFGLDKRQVSGILSEIKSLSKEANNATDSAEALSRELNETGKKANALGDVTESFEAFGRGDFLKGFEKFKKGMADLQGSGGLPTALKASLAVAGIGMVGNALEKVTSKALELKREYKAGNITAGEMADQLARSIPVLGNIYAAGRNIRALIDDTNDSLEQSIEIQERMFEQRKKIIDVAQKAAEDAEKAAQKTEDINNEIQAKMLEAAGANNQAVELRLEVKFATDLRQQQEQLKKEAAASIKQLDEQLSAKGEKSGLSLYEQRSKAAQEVLEIEKQITELENGKAKSLDQRDRHAAVVELEELRKQLSYAEADFNQYNGVITGNQKQRKKIEDELNVALKEREAALNKLKETEKQALNTKPLTDAQKAQVAAAMAISPAMGEALRNSFQEQTTAAQRDAQELGKTIAEHIGQGLKSALGDKAKTVEEWVKKHQQEAERRKKEAEKEAERVKSQMQNEANKVKEQSKSELDKFNDELGKAVDLKNKGFLSGDQLDSFLTKNATDLMDEAKELEDSERPVFELPDVAEMRAGQTLFVPPNKIEEKALERLEEIAELLAAIKAKANEGSVVVEEISI